MKETKKKVAQLRPENFLDGHVTYLRCPIEFCMPHTAISTVNVANTNNVSFLFSLINLNGNSYIWLVTIISDSKDSQIIRVLMNALEIGALEQGLATLFCKKGQRVVY